MMAAMPTAALTATRNQNVGAAVWRWTRNPGKGYQTLLIVSPAPKRKTAPTINTNVASLILLPASCKACAQTETLPTLPGRALSEVHSGTQQRPGLHLSVRSLSRRHRRD